MIDQSLLDVRRPTPAPTVESRRAHPWREGVRVRSLSRPGLGVALVLALLLGPALPMSAVLSAEGIPADKLADLTLKILTYDRNLKGRASDKVWVAIVATPSNRAASDLVRAFDGRRVNRVSGLGFETVVFAPGDLVANGAGRDKKLTCLVVFPDPGLDVQAVSQFARKNGILSLTPSVALVGPLSLGLSAEQGKIRMYRSDEALGAEKIQLAGDFLALTQAR